MILTKEKANSIFSVVQVYICMNITLMVLELIAWLKIKKTKALSAMVILLSR